MYNIKHEHISTISEYFETGRNMRDEQNYLKQIEKIFKMKKEDVEREFPSQKRARFYTYYKRFFENPKKLKAYSKFCKHILDVTNAKRKKVLDIGCGWGLISIHLGVFGAKVVGVEMDPEKIGVFQKILRSLVLPLDNIEVRLGDALEIDFKEEKFDVIICSEVISHIRNSDLLLLKMNKALKRGGFLYISDWNNGLNILQRHKRRIIWERAEYKYKSLRKKIIKEMLTSKQDELTDLLAEKTAGMYGDEIPRAIGEYLREGKITNKAVSKSRDPVSGIYLERELNPFALRKALHKLGFRAKILHPYFFALEGRSLFVMFLAKGIRMFHPLSLFVSPRFEILAEKA